MFLLHYLIPIAIYYFIKKDKVILFGLLAGNLVDLDHVYYRLIGKVGWFESACSGGSQCSIGTYPSHDPLFLIVFTAVGMLTAYFILSEEKKKLKGLIWILTGVLLHLVLDYIALITGVSI